VIVSRSSGVTEVLRHALKVDFWDVREIANKIVGVLRHPPLAEVLRENAFAETLHLTWERAARGCLKTYARLTGHVKLVLIYSNLPRWPVSPAARAL
jgi:glycosyltransferase involved in cell wall biosynthesis